VTRPALLITGAYPTWDLKDLMARYLVVNPAFLTEHGPEIRALATRGDLDASAELMRDLPASRSSPATASGPTRSTSHTLAPPGSA
jgi:hypothetical protein